jgi:hypothetical protein
MDVQEVILLKRERKNRNKVNIDKLLENVHKRIKFYASLNRDSCTYKIPPIMDGLPLFNLQDVTIDVFKKLDSEGYIVNAYSDGNIEICWDEKMVEEKVKRDSYVLSTEEKRLKIITKKNKNVDKRFTFLANPKKTAPSELSADDQLNLQLEKILQEKKQQQNKFKKIISNK